LAHKGVALVGVQSLLFAQLTHEPNLASPVTALHTDKAGLVLKGEPVH